MRVTILGLRACFIAWVFATALLRYLVARLGGRGKTQRERDRLRGETLAHALETLGATFVKLGQILATRPDLLSPGLTEGLARLQDRVPAASFAEVREVLDEELSPSRRAKIRSIDETPLAAASVAQVHRGELADGTKVALKIQRKDARSQIERDLALMKLGAAILDVLPGMKWVSIPGALAQFARALREQLDFGLEAENNRAFARNFASDPRVRVPKLEDELCTRRLLVMELVVGVKPTDVETDREGLARAGFSCIAQMVFLDGFVHADMHPGNILFTREGLIYLIDLGLVATIPDDLRKPWTDTFVAVALGDGVRASELFYGFAPEVSDTDYAAFEADVCAHFEKLHGRPLSELEVTTAVGGAMAILRKHHVQVDPVFTVVNLAMLVAEGIGKQLDPKIDVFSLVMPFLAEACLRFPTGRTPLRPIPGRS